MKLLSMNYERAREAEAICSKLQYEIHNLDSSYCGPQRLKTIALLYRELGKAIKLAAVQYTVESEKTGGKEIV